MEKIFVFGLTSTQLGGMELHNLGNYIIMESFFKFLRKEFPSAKINTSIQMSNEFCKKYNVNCKRHKRFWTYGKLTAFETVKDIIRLILWRTLKIFFKKNLDILLNKSVLLKEIKESNLVIDISGDIYGNNASYNQFLEGCVEIIFAKALGKPVAMLIGSPGPFSKWRLILAKYIINKIDLITNREPESTKLLTENGIKNPNIYTTACPSFLFKGTSRKEIHPILIKEGLSGKKNTPVVGLILSGWNMPIPPFSKIPREDWELEPFLDLIKYVVKNLGARILLMSHQNRTDKQGNLISGTDHAIINRIYNLIDNDEIKKNVLKLKGLYNAKQTKTIIGTFDMLISGRIHGAVNGLSQCIPTVIINYGHEPKAHKLVGFAKIAGVENYLADPSDAKDMIDKTSEMWKNKNKIHQSLCERIPKVKELALSNFKLLKKYFTDGYY